MIVKIKNKIRKKTEGRPIESACKIVLSVKIRVDFVKTICYTVDKRSGAMFTKVYLKNFRSFDEFELNLTRKNGIPKKLAIIYGENGAGKSNLMSAFVLLNELKQTMDVRDFYEELLSQESPFKDKEIGQSLKKQLIDGLRDIRAIIRDYRMIGCEDIIVAEYEFCIGNNFGSYRVEFDQEEIVYERLEYLLNKRRGVHFECSRDGIEINKAIIKDKDFYTDIKATAKRFWGKHSLLAIIEHELADKANSYGRENLSETFFDVLIELSMLSCFVKYGHRQWNSIYAPLSVFNSADSGKIPKAKESQLDLAEQVFTQFFSAINSDIHRAYYKRSYSDKWVEYSLHLDKTIAGKDCSIDFAKESTGNHQLLDVLCYLLIACLDGVVVLDEADSGIHDLLFKKIIQEIAGNISGQVIMTTHNTTLMETDFARESTYVMSEEETGRMVVRAISNYENRTYISNNIRNKYLNNDYEGLPKVTEIDFAPIINKIIDKFN